MKKNEASETIEEKIEVPSAQTYLPTPWITIFIGVVCVVLFVGINSESNLTSWDTFFKWGAPPPDAIWNGHFGGLITSNFLHVDFLHLVFNLYWLWVFGQKIESEIRRVIYLFLILSSGFITSTVQLAFSDSTGIGFSGIGYAMFGFIFINSKLDKSNKWFLEQKIIILFLFWLIFCVFLSYTGIWQIGNVSHFSGLLWGILLGYLSTISNKKLAISLPILFLIISSIPLFWSPWSISWLSTQAYNFHKDQNYERAKIFYVKILEKDSANSFALENLKQIKIMELSEKAKNLAEKGDVENAKKILKEILEIDPNDKWAKEVNSMLP